MTVTSRITAPGGTKILTTSLDATEIRVPTHLTTEAILQDIDNLRFSPDNPLVTGLPSHNWNGTCAVGTPTAEGLADIVAFLTGVKHGAAAAS